MGRLPNARELARQGVAVVVATRDAALRPAVGRAWGPVLSDAEDELTLCVEAAPGSPMEANLAAGSPLAATLSRPTTYSSIQLKGAVTQIRPPTDAELERVALHVDGFVVETAAVGLDPALARRLVGQSLTMVVVAVSERYDQTPGSGAGARL